MEERKLRNVKKIRKHAVRKLQARSKYKLKDKFTVKIRTSTLLYETY